MTLSAFFFGGCADDGPVRTLLGAGTLFETQNFAVVIGDTPPSDASAELGIIAAARLNPTDSSVVVLDVVAPHIKLFDRAGNAIGTRVGSGSGPGEAKHPVGVSFLDSSIVVLAADPAELILVPISGGAAVHVPLGAIVPLATASVCGDVVVYGPAGLAGNVAWLHRYESLDGGLLHVWSGLYDNVPNGVPLGKPQGMIAARGGLILRHDNVNGSRVVHWSCNDDGSLQIMSDFQLNEAGWFPDALALKRELSVPRVVPAGIALVDDILITATLRSESTQFKMWSLAGELIGQASVKGRFVISDAVDGKGILFTQSDEIPRALMMDQTVAKGLVR